MDSRLIIYPTARKVADQLKRETRGGGCVLGRCLATLPQIVDWLWRERADGRMTIGPIGERMALGEALARLNETGGNIRPLPGFRDHLLAVIRQFKSSAIRPEDLSVAAESIAPDGQPRMRLFHDVFAAYEEELARREVAGDHDREREALAMLHRMEAAGRRPRFLAGVERLTVAEIYDFSIVQFMIVASLIRMIGDAELTIQAQPHAVGATNRFAELTWGKFVAEESIADKVLPEFARRDGRSGRLGFLIEHIFTERPADPPEDDATLRIVEAPNAMREAEESARAIRRLLETPGGPTLDRIAIVARDLSLYADYLESAFRRCRIPLEIARRDTLRATPPARAAIDLLKLQAENFSREALWSLCNAPSLRIGARKFRDLPVECGYIDRQARPLAECIATRRREFERASAEAEPERRAELSGRLGRFDRGAGAWRELLEIVEALEPETTAAVHARRTLDALRRLGLDPAGAPAAESAMSAAVVEAFEELAREASIVAPDCPMTVAEFAALAESALLETAVATAGNSDSGGVRAMPVLEARGLDFDIVFVLGLSDGAFPLHHSEDPLRPDEWIRAVNRPLRDALRRRMGARAPDAPGPIMRTRYDRNAEEPFLFFLALSMPSREIVLSYSAADERGNPLPRSPFITEAIGLLGGDDGENLVRRIPPEDFIAPADDCFAESEFINRAAWNGILDDAGLGEIAPSGAAAWIIRRTEIERRRETYFGLATREEMLATRFAARKRSENGSGPLDLSPFPEKFGAASIFDGFAGAEGGIENFLRFNPDGGPRQWSASQLSQLAACGFAYFAGRILMLREDDEPDYEQSALETGGMVHQVLADLFSVADLDDASAFRRAAAEALERRRRRYRAEARDLAFFDLGWDSIEAMVREVVEYELWRRASGPIPDAMEHESPIEFTVAGPAPRDVIALQGRIDRLEIYREKNRIRRLKVVDYKMSRKRDPYEKLLTPELFASHDLQMGVYALGAVEKFRGELARDAIVEASYIALRSRNKEAGPWAIPPGMLERDPAGSAARNGEASVAGRIAALVETVAAGRFDIDPLKCSDYCPHRRVCRYNK